MNKTDNGKKRYWVSIGDWYDPPDEDWLKVYNDTKEKLEQLFDGHIPESFKTHDREEAIRIARQAEKIILEAYGVESVYITTQPYCKDCGYLGRFGDTYCPTCGTELAPSECVDFKEDESALVNPEKKADMLMYLLHEIKHGLGDKEIYDWVTGIFPYFRRCEDYNPERHPSTLLFLFNMVLMSDEEADKHRKAFRAAVVKNKTGVFRCPKCGADASKTGPNPFHPDLWAMSSTSHNDVHVFCASCGHTAPIEDFMRKDWSCPRCGSKRVEWRPVGPIGNGIRSMCPACGYSWDETTLEPIETEMKTTDKTVWARFIKDADGGAFAEVGDVLSMDEELGDELVADGYVELIEPPQKEDD